MSASASGQVKAGVQGNGVDSSVGVVSDQLRDQRGFAASLANHSAEAGRAQNTFLFECKWASDVPKSRNNLALPPKSIAQISQSRQWPHPDNSQWV